MHAAVVVLSLVFCPIDARRIQTVSKQTQRDLSREKLKSQRPPSQSAQSLGRVSAKGSPALASGLANKDGEEAIVFLNGEYVPDSKALVSAHDFSFLYGYGCFDTTRTYNGRLRDDKLDKHVDRFFQSMKALRMESPLTKAEWKAVAHEVVERNQHMIEYLGGDAWLFLRCTPGAKGYDSGMTYMAEIVPIPFAERAPKYVHGLEMVTVGTRRVPPQCVPARIKSHSYLNNMLAEAEAKASNPNAYALMQDMDGNIAEGSTYNFFIVKDGQVLCPREQNTLAGISRDTIINLCGQLGLPFIEKDMDLYDVYNADEAFLTSTSLCLCPVTSVNGMRIGDQSAGDWNECWGPVSMRLREAYIKSLDGFDFVEQYLKQYDPTDAEKYKPKAMGTSINLLGQRK